MKAKYAVCLIFLGIMFWILGVVFRIEHWPLPPLFFLLYMTATPIGLVILLYKILRYPGFKDFLDR